MVVGPTPGAEFPLDGERLRSRRSEDATISIGHSSVSRLHAELIGLGSGRYEVVDKQSANGVRINGVELKRGLLEAGDALELGGDPPPLRRCWQDLSRGAGRRAWRGAGRLRERGPLRAVVPLARRGEQGDGAPARGRLDRRHRRDRGHAPGRTGPRRPAGA